MSQFVLPLALAAGLLLSLALLRFRSERATLLSALRTLIRHKAAPLGVNRKLSFTLPIWRAALKLHELRLLESREKQTASRLLSAGSRISSATSDQAQLFSELNALLREYLGPELLALAILTRTKDGWNIAQLDGLSATRASDLLLQATELIFPQLRQQRAVYVQPERDSLCDFRVFGIGLSLFLPLRSPNDTEGMLWLGISRQALSLSAERRAFIQNIAEYAAASYYAAQKLWQREAHAHQEKDFLIGMSHDLRTPGTSALYAVRDLLSGELGNLSPEQHLRLRIIERSIDDQLNIVGDVLDFARHQRGLLEARRVSTSLDDLCRPLWESFALLAAERELDLIVDELPQLNLLVDPRHFQRMLSNLLSNAIKYSDRGQILIQARIEGAHCNLSVRDQGIGIPEGERAGLFEEFRRFENARMRNGSGLGLSLTRVLAGLNNGAVSYQPNPTGGSIFSLQLEIAPSVSGAKQVSSVLVVDDDEASLRTNMRYLRDVSDTLYPAADSNSALQLALENNPDLIVTDFHLDQHTALEFMEALHNRKICIPTVIVSGSGENHLKDFPGKVRVLQKPVGRAELQGAIEDLLAEQHDTVRHHIYSLPRSNG